LLASRVASRATDLREASSGRIYIQEVTQLEISSSGVRALVGQGGDRRFLLPHAVAAIIEQTGCYGRPQQSNGTKERNHA
jgi:nicotinate-nucleotide adenylyltransferase